MVNFYFLYSHAFLGPYYAGNCLCERVFYPPLGLQFGFFIRFPRVSVRNSYPLLVQPQTNYDQNTSWIRIRETQLKCLAGDQENAASVRWHSFASWNSFRPLRLSIPVPKSAFSFHLLNNAHIRHVSVAALLAGVSTNRNVSPLTS